jgi:hypothetical protein
MEPAKATMKMITGYTVLATEKSSSGKSVQEW